MPASYLVDEARGVVFIRCWGVLTENDLVLMNESVNGPRVRTEGLHRVVNLIDVTEVRISSEGIRSIAEIARRAPVGRRALVAGTGVNFGLARMFEQNLRLPETSSQVFRDLSSAMEFVGLEPDTPWPAGKPDVVRGIAE